MSVNSSFKATKIIGQRKAFCSQMIPECSCARKETIDIDILVISRYGDKKIMPSFRITSRPPPRIRSPQVGILKRASSTDVFLWISPFLQNTLERLLLKCVEYLFLNLFLFLWANLFWQKQFPEFYNHLNEQRFSFATICVESVVYCIS